MNYKRETYKRYNPRYNPRYNVKYIGNQAESINKNVKKHKKIISIILIAILALSVSYMSVKECFNKGDSSFKTTILYKAINNSMATLGASAKNTVRNEDKGIEAFNIQQAIKDQLGFFRNKKNKDKTKSVMNETYNLNEFNLNEKDINKNEVGNASKQDLAKNGSKKILIYHTHTCEAYSPGEARKKDLSLTVASVGEELTKHLKSKGFTVMHDTTFHDNVDYNNAYYKSRETMKKYINEFGDFDLIIDIHRDGGVPKARVTGNVNGDSVAKLTFVPATANPRYKKQLEKMNKIVVNAQKLYPELFREIPIYEEYTTGITYYSQDLSDGAVLIEVGSDSNTLDEAKNSMKYLSEAIRLALN